jgi:UDP-N-acetylmuramoyl-L-alanyl-D-glutamate--2,6-diaminopimelate ligase
MRLGDLLKGIETLRISGDAQAEITGISYDSRRVNPGHLFVAMPGEKTDGRAFIQDAVRRGAVAVIHQESGDRSQETEEGNSKPSYIQVKDSRQALAVVSNNFFMHPSDALTVIGITGTNGKTTSTYLIKSILENWGKKVGLIGTIQYMIGNDVYDATHTTPEALEFQGFLHEMLRSGCTHVVSEVSSHALAQKRVDGTVFRAGIFTNLTRDHLDFHKTMEDYFQAKARLFRELLAEDAVSVINYDDAYGRRLISEFGGGRSGAAKLYAYGLETGSDLMAADIKDSFDGLRFSILMREKKYAVSSPLMGLPNVYNILSAAAVATGLGIPWSVILEGIRKAGTVKGRFEKVDAGQRFLAVVDYAHTSDALERLIFSARGLTGGKIITVFGCGGERDRGKRPVMCAIATRLSDFVIITSDNPRHEKPGEIIREVEAGAMRKNYLVEPDRREAIKRAVLMAEENDVVLVAGKGHEHYQEIEGKRVQFSDREVLEEAIRQLIKNS